ncbi:MAG: GNAT family N-acetyltransferase, partial [Armatimonadota bacterium]|nr:GNAT family N-acetyltransferase [Armatimonadota bacterium]
MMRPLSRNGHELYLRPLRVSDVDRLLAFFVSLSPESRRLFRPYAFTRDDAARACSEAEGDRSTRLVIIRPQGDAIVGYGYFTEAGVADPRIPILGIAIADSYQNMGLGRALMEALIEEARLQGKLGLQLTVYKENARAIHLYSRLGFQLTGEADNGRQHAMRLAFAARQTAHEERGVLLDPLPFGLTHLTPDTWTADEWRSYLDFLHIAGANLVMVFVWPSQYYHPDVPATLPNAWRLGVLREALR